ncbi:MAG: asnB 1 [Myxococcales bacterium]|nr:asnB 1 [Myxococcales bacterium]
MSSPDRLPSVLGDFVLAWGEGAAMFIDRLSGYTRVSEPGEPAQAAVRGDARHGRAADGTRWLAVADLVSGDLAAGAAAITNGSAPPQRDWRGRFVQVAWDPATRRAVALTDHFSTLSLYTMVHDGVLVVGTDFRVVASSPWCARKLDLEAIYHYFNFAHIPAPKSLFTDVRRLEPSTRFSWQDGRAADERYWLPEYPEDLRGTDESLANELQERMVASVNDYRPPEAQPWGCFLSGGTDSSSITSILSRRGRVKSFSIGFAEEKYDELSWARLAAQACGADPTFHSVSQVEAQALLSRVVEAYDQPFGGTSSVPTLACADLATGVGMKMLVAGDGGDEIFGGNERYAKDRIMETWYAMPAPVKAVGRAVGGAAGRSGNFFLNRVENFFERASLPNPDRFYTDDSFASDHYDAMLTPEFRGAVARDASLDWMRGVYRLGSSGGPLHRVMRLDLQNAIAQHDIRKVDSATRATGVSVRFPYLDPKLVSWVNRLPEHYKVRGLKKRYLFKLATRGILPVEILKKKKQGFGLPISVWMRSDPPFQAMMKETLFDARTRARGFWRQEFVERLIADHESGSWDHSDYLFRLLMLELWLRRHVDAS